MVPLGLAEGDDSLMSLSRAGPLYGLDSSPKKVGGPYSSLGGLFPEACGEVW